MKRLRLLALLAMCLLLTCDRGDQITDPFASISDGSHLAGNRNFFFLPPLVPNPSGSPGYEPLAFDPTVRPTVQICRLEGASCAPSQPDGFPLVYTMETGPGGETVRLLELDQQFVVKWHAGDFHLDPASDYRITVLVTDAPLGYADVDVVSSGRELRNVSTNEFIGLVEGRTLSIKFRIERGAITSVDIAETIAVGDQPNVLAPVLVTVQETMAVADVVAMLPALLVDVHEGIVVSDQVRIVPPSAVQILETIAVADGPRVQPPAVVTIAEMVAITDQPRVLPPISISINETIAVTDAVAVTPP